MGGKIPSRKNIRLRDYDYSSAGYYFITICTKDGKSVLGTMNASIDAGVVGTHSVRPKLFDIGEIAMTAIENIPQIYELISIDNYVIMPNHIHMILVIHSNHESGRTLCAPTVSRVIKQMKEYVTKQIGYSIWQKSFYEHIIRNENDYKRIWQYINENPTKWQDDKYYTPS